MSAKKHQPYIYDPFYITLQLMPLESPDKEFFNAAVGYTELGPILDANEEVENRKRRRFRRAAWPRPMPPSRLSLLRNQQETGQPSCGARTIPLVTGWLRYISSHPNLVSPGLILFTCPSVRYTRGMSRPPSSHR